MMLVQNIHDKKVMSPMWNMAIINDVCKLFFVILMREIESKESQLKCRLKC